MTFIFKQKNDWIQSIAKRVREDSIGTKRAYKLSHLFFTPWPNKWVEEEKKRLGTFYG